MDEFEGRLPARSDDALFLAASATQVSTTTSATAATAVTTGATIASTAASAPQASGKVPTVNWALSGQATAGASQAGNPAADAIDGDAATSWCTSSWPDTLTVDLGQVRNLDGIGITLDSISSSANASISVATQQGDWHAVSTARNIALDPGNPMYVPLGRSSGKGNLPADVRAVRPDRGMGQRCDAGLHRRVPALRP